MTQTLQCPDCGARMNFVFCTKFMRHFYRCQYFPTCRGSHRANSEGKPVGVPGNQQTRLARWLAHEMLAKVQGQLKFSTTEMYGYVADLMSLPESQAHLGKFTFQQCALLLRLLSDRHGIPCPDLEPPDDPDSEREGLVSE